MNLELILGIIMIIMGLISLIYTINAKKKFPQESELNFITGRLIVIIGFLTCFAALHVTREAFFLKEQYGEFIEYPEYACIIITFMMIILTSKHIYITARNVGITK